MKISKLSASNPFPFLETKPLLSPPAEKFLTKTPFIDSPNPKNPIVKKFSAIAGRFS